MFWFWILLLTVFIVGVSVLVAKMTSPKPRGPSDPNDRRKHMTALKVSGALPHRKSSRH